MGEPVHVQSALELDFQNDKETTWLSHQDISRFLFALMVKMQVDSKEMTFGKISSMSILELQKYLEMRAGSCVGILKTDKGLHSFPYRDDELGRKLRGDKK